MSVVAPVLAALFVAVVGGFMAAGFYGLIQAEGYPKLATVACIYFALFTVTGVLAVFLT